VLSKEMINRNGTIEKLCDFGMNKTGMKLGLTTRIFAMTSSHFRGAGGKCSVVAMLINVITVFGFCATPEVYSQDGVELGREVFSKKNYPWYDAQTDQVKRVEVGERPAAKSKNRNDIALKPVRQRANRGAWNWNGSFLGGLSVFAWVMIGMVIAALAAILIWALMRMEPNQPIQVDDLPIRTIEESIKQLPFDLDPVTGDFRQLAQHAFDAGDYQKAMIYLFSHVLVSLDQKGLIRLRKGKTNRQYLSELRLHGALAKYFQRVMIPFEATFFGDHDLKKTEFESSWNELSNFETRVEHSTQVANV